MKNTERDSTHIPIISILESGFLHVSEKDNTTKMAKREENAIARFAGLFSFLKPAVSGEVAVNETVTK